MSAIDGEQTGLFGVWLEEYLSKRPEFTDWIVYYGHGDSRLNSKVGKIKGIYGEVLSTITQLSHVDVMVVKPGGEIALLIEIEESANEPKKIIADVIASRMCTRFAVGQGKNNRYFEVTPQTSFVVAEVINPKGKKAAQLETVIVPRLSQFVGPPDGIYAENVSFVFRSHIDEVLEALKEWIERYFSEIETLVE